MRTEYRVEQRRQERLRSDVAKRIAGLFQRCPELHGFTVQRDPDVHADTREARGEFGLMVADVTVADGFGYTSTDAREEIVATLFELLDEYPEAHELLRGHTFARSFN